MAEEKPVDVRLAEIRARLAAASPGPWLLHHRMIGAGPDDDERVGLGWDWDDDAGPPGPMRGVFARAADAKFVANIHDDMAYLLAQLAAKDEEIKAAETGRVHGWTVASGDANPKREREIDYAAWLAQRHQEKEKP